MKLRARLALSLLVAALPVVAAIAWMRARFEWRGAEQALVEYTLERMQNGGRELCEADPASFSAHARDRSRSGPGGPGGPGGPDWPGGRHDEHGPGPPPGPPPGDGRSRPPPEPRHELWAYASDFESANPQAPEIPVELRRAVEAGADVASGTWDGPRRAGIQALVRTEWSAGPCAFVLARRAEFGSPGAVRDLVWSALVLCGALVVAVLVAAGPIVGRVRRLTRQVRESAASRYSVLATVEGRDEIAELANTFNAAASEVHGSLEALEAREQTLRGFVENTVHDVMLPLTVLQGHLTALRRKSGSGASIESATVVDALQETHYMASLIQNLSAAARLESGSRAMARHPVDLNALVERAVARHAPIASAGSIVLEHAVPPSPLSVEGDVTLLEQAVSNLIHNAVRYVEPNGHVAVVLEERGADFSLRVLDDGPGIPVELETRVFERSFRTDAARSRHPSGMGLGLSIAKHVAEQHGLRMTLRRPSDGGTEIELAGPRLSVPPHDADDVAALH